MTTHPVRFDALPEYHQYVDEGCNFHPSCLCCPAEFCRYDARKGIYTLRTLSRDSAIIEGRRQHGLSERALANRHHVSRSTIQRILAQARRISP